MTAKIRTGPPMDDAADLSAGTWGGVLSIATGLGASAVVGTDLLPVTVACIVLLAVALSVAGLSVPITRGTLFGAGVTGGVIGTLTGIGAPPIAILYARIKPRRSAATQNAFFGSGMAVSILTLALAGLIGAPHLALAASFVPLVPSPCAPPDPTQPASSAARSAPVPLDSPRSRR